MNDIKLVIACHKKVDSIPKNKIYLPLEVGASLHEENFYDAKDNTGINISDKNASFCELTGLYWAYKNLDFDVLGLVHYRRYFMKSSFCLRKNLNNVIDEKRINKIFNKYDVILPKKRHYYIESNYSHYVHAHKKEALDITREIIKENFPDYLNSFDEHMKKRSGHYFNMFIGKKEIIVPFLDWMFSILFELENRINLENYVGAEKRVFGFVSELLFDVYFKKNNLKIKSQKYLFFEKQNWFKKGLNFIKRKFVRE